MLATNKHNSHLKVLQSVLQILRVSFDRTREIHCITVKQHADVRLCSIRHGTQTRDHVPETKTNSLSCSFAN